MDGQVRVVGLFDASYDLRIYAERLAYVYNLLCIFLRQIDFKAVTAVEYLVHLLPFCLALLLNGAEQRRDGEEVILDYVYSVYKVQDLGLCTA